MSLALGLNARCLWVLLFLVSQTVAAQSQPEQGLLSGLEKAICPVVYPLEQRRAIGRNIATEREQGVRYAFFGNAFFISKAGYLLTAAHVLEAFRGGGEPHILVSKRTGERHLLLVSLVSADWEHDVALLRAQPNPFDADPKDAESDDVAFLPLATQVPAVGVEVVSITFRPPRLATAYVFEPLHAQVSNGSVIGYRFTRLGGGNGETELLLFSERVLPGQSGAPLLRADTGEVVGIIGGRWLRGEIPYLVTPQKLSPEPGAAVRIHYALRLLRAQQVDWEIGPMTAPGSGQMVNPSTASVTRPVFTNVAPVPLSVVGPMYPLQTLFGGEVLIDAQIDAEGKVAELQMVEGERPFNEKALAAFGTWTFLPALADGQPIVTRLGVIFQFAQPRLQSPTPLVRRHESYIKRGATRAALPALTLEPSYPPTSVAEGSVLLYAVVDAVGEVTSLHILYDLPPLTGPAIEALKQWRFLPALVNGEPADSAAVIIITFRRPVLAPPRP